MFIKEIFINLSVIYVTFLKMDANCRSILLFPFTFVLYSCECFKKKYDKNELPCAHAILSGRLVSH